MSGEERTRGTGAGDPYAGYAAAAGEAVRLLEALQHAAAGWAGSSRADTPPGEAGGCGCDNPDSTPDAADGGHDGTDGHHEHHEHHEHQHDGPPVTCRACPVCLLLGAVYRARPEVVGHLADAGASLAAALAEVAAAATTTTRGDTPRGRGPAAGRDPGSRADPPGNGGWHGTTWSARPAEPVQHIDVTD